jgi:phosphatidylcholine synthase
VLVLFALAPSHYTILAIVVALTIAMFLNLKFIHPTRTKRWRYISMPMSCAWVVFAAWAAWVNFGEGSWAHWGLVLSSLYLTFAGIAQQIFPERARHTP